MKTTKRKVLVFVFMLAALLNYANDKKNLDTTLDSKKVKVVFKDVKKGHTLTIKDESGDLIHKENIAENGKLIKVYDLTFLKNGNYKIELNKDYQIIVKTFIKTADKVTFKEEGEKVIFKPVIRSDKNLIMLSKISFDKKPLKVTIYYNDSVILSETLTSETIINRVYKLDESKKGDYNIVIHNNKKSYSKKINI